ncbi:MAG TPA: NADH-quinone oxidoreductase subunit D [Actinomycetota bacterium]|nr:NADH-quinone oxidoreductase subunit D [Actinomycetota bacterium]
MSQPEVFVGGQDWDTLVARTGEDTLIVNMGPQHPSTHGVLRLVLELDGETVVNAHSVVGYLHTGIEKNAEVRNWTQGVTFVTRADYLAPFFNETAYCMAVEKMLGAEVPARAQAIRVMLMELNRIASHLVWLATGGMELGALSMMLYGFREREQILDIFEHVTGLRMNHAFVRPGGLSTDLPEGTLEKVNAFVESFPAKVDEYEELLTENQIWIDRNRGVGLLEADVALGLGVTGPLLRAAGVPLDLRKQTPYCGYEKYDFEVATKEAGDCEARYLVRVKEMRESTKIVKQVAASLPDGPVMVEDRKIAWPAQLQLGEGGLGNAPEYIRKIMGESMEALIHHFKLVTEGFKVPAGEAYVPIESPRGELGYHIVSSGGTKPWRVHDRDPSFINLQAMPHMVRGGLIADVIASVASIDPVMGGVDR